MKNLLRGVRLVFPTIQESLTYGCLSTLLLLSVLMGLRYEDDAENIALVAQASLPVPEILGSRLLPDQVRGVQIDGTDPLLGKLVGTVDVVFSNSAGNVIRFRFENPFVERRSADTEEWSVARKTYTTLLDSLALDKNSTAALRSASLWGMDISRFGTSAKEAAQSCFVEMVCHVWLVACLPFLCLCASRRVAETFTTTFQEFLRFGRASCLLSETIRLVTVATIVPLAMVPFALVGVAAVWQLDFEAKLVLSVLMRCSEASVVVVSMLYLLLAARALPAVAVALSMVSPFLWTGISQMSDRITIEGTTPLEIAGFLPAGLPYELAAGSPDSTATFVYAALVIVIRLLGALDVRSSMARRAQQCAATGMRRP